jgi:hypothetical protein
MGVDRGSSNAPQHFFAARQKSPIKSQQAPENPSIVF